MFVCLFVWVFRPTREFFTHMETSPLPMKGCKFDLCSELMIIEQWGFLSVPHKLCQGASIYYGHLRGPVTLRRQRSNPLRPAAMYRQYKQYFTSRMNMYSLYTVWSFKTISNWHFLESSFKIDLPPRSPGDQRSQTYCFCPVCHFVILSFHKEKVPIRPFYNPLIFGEKKIQFESKIIINNL